MPSHSIESEISGGGFGSQEVAATWAHRVDGTRGVGAVSSAMAVMERRSRKPRYLSVARVAGSGRPVAAGKGLYLLYAPELPEGYRSPAQYPVADRRRMDSPIERAK